MKKKNSTMSRITSDNIEKLKVNQKFVFGSNLSGFHGGGAAKMAQDNFGAKWGQSNGIQGESYAIPTKSEFIKRTLTIDEIRPYVDEFIEFAKQNKDMVFLVTPIGCGLAGLNPQDVAPLFKESINLSNVHLPYSFWDKMGVEKYLDFLSNQSQKLNLGYE